LEPTIESLIAQANSGDQSAHQRLFEALYADLHRLARRELGRSGGGISLGVTTLLHEAYVDISGREGNSFPDRARFMAYAAKAMRGLIIDYYRARRAEKRGGEFKLVSFNTGTSEPIVDDRELARIGEALETLATAEPALAQIVDLKFFCGFTVKEIAVMRGVSERTVQREWEKARIFLHRTLQDESVLE
jgi:RNA polymerase sigma factor (TIGR02999 family)